MRKFLAGLGTVVVVVAVLLLIGRQRSPNPSHTAVSLGENEGEGEELSQSASPRAGVGAREVTPANEIHWNGRAWAVKDTPDIRDAVAHPVDLDARFEAAPEKWMDTEVWMYNQGAERERIYECHRAAKDLKSPCDVEFTMVTERVNPREATVQYVEPRFEQGGGEVLCEELARCLAGVRLRSSVPIPEDAPWINAFTRRERLHPTAGMSSEEKIAIFEQMLSGLKTSLSQNEADPHPDDPMWQREIRVLKNSIEHVEWIIARMQQ